MKESPPTIYVHVYDPPMCCSTGVCGPSVDSRLVRFGADLGWLTTQGVAVERFNLSQQPGAFVADTAVKAALETLGEEALPVVKVDGRVKSTGVYPSRSDLAEWTGLNGAAPSVYSESVNELVAIGAAIASNCEPCFRFHYDKARRLGVSHEDMLLAVRMAQAVKDSPAKAVLQLAERYLLKENPRAETPAAADESSEAEPAGCCGPVEPGEQPASNGGSCC